MRALIAEKPVVGLVIAVVILAAVGFMAIARSGPPAGEGSRYYYNITSGEVIAYKADESLPPVALPTGDQGVLAHVFTCGDCNGETFVGYLEMYTDEYKAAATVSPEDTPGPIIAPPAGHLIAVAPDQGVDIQWVPMDWPQGRRIRQNSADRCGKDAIRCMP